MKEDESMESRIQQAMRSRMQHFRDQADSLTFEGVRRLLEKDLDLDKHALDAHKRYVKQSLEKYLSDAEDNGNASKGSEKINLEQVTEEEEERPKEHKVTDTRSEGEGKVEDSPVMGLLSGNESAKSGNSKSQGNEKDKIPNEDMITEAIWKKAEYFRSKSEELTVAGVRRLLEDDLELEKFSLDSFKKLISKQLDKVLSSENDAPHKTNSKSDANSSPRQSDGLGVEAKPKKKLAPKGKVQKSEGPKKRKKPAQETKQAREKKIKHAEEMSVDKKIAQDVFNESSDEKSESSAGKPMKKEVVAPVYGKKVERLKTIIKNCGMIVAPSVYRRAKQVHEHEREAFLLKELEEILSKEGLSTNPTEKEIKEVKRRKEKAKELEGIDTSNIVLGSRRRSTFNFVTPPKPKEPIDSDDDKSENSDTDNEDDSEENDDDEGSDKIIEEDGSGENDNEDGSEENDDEDGEDHDEEDKGDANKSEEAHEEDTRDSD